MPTPDTKTYSLANDFGGAINEATMMAAVNVDPNVAVHCNHVGLEGDVVSITFDDALPAGQKTTLDSLVTAHDSTPTPTALQQVEIATPPIVIPFPGREGWRTWFTGAGDDLAPEAPASGRGTGPALRLSLSGGDDAFCECSFNEPVQLHTGEIHYDSSFKMTDYAEFSIVVPANAPTEPSSGSSSSGDEEEPVEVLKVNVGGPYHLIVPYPGGGHEMLMSEASPVLDDAGEWWADPETGAVKIWAGADNPDFRCRLYDFQLESFFLRRAWLGATSGHFQPPQVYKAEWLHPKQKIKLYAKKVSTGAGEIAAWLMCYRAKST